MKSWALAHVFVEEGTEEFLFDYQPSVESSVPVDDLGGRLRAPPAPEGTEIFFDGQPSVEMPPLVKRGICRAFFFRRAAKLAKD